jgi:phosphoglycerate kinase
MVFTKKTIRDVPLDGQRVLVRADYNVPLDGATIANDYRLTQSLPTLKHLLERGCQLVICSHLGRPDGKVDPKLSLEPVAARLGELLGKPVGFIPATIGDKVAQATKRLRTGQILLLENLRFYPEEEANDLAFARKIAKDSGAAYFVQDGFGVAHRAHASTSAITQCLPSVAGLLLEHEVTTIEQAMASPKPPLVAIVGGAKISDKLAVIERFITMADQIVIGGAMANTFLQYKNLPIGKSIHEEGQKPVIDSIYKKALSKLRGQQSVDAFIYLPTDVVVAKSLDPDVPTQTIRVQEVAGDDFILDVGPQSAASIVGLIQKAKTVIWNGTLGMAEQPTYAHASEEIAAALAAQKDTSLNLIGGGDTADFVLEWSKTHNKTCGYVSTGGGASLELMSGKKLPGLEILMDR